MITTASQLCRFVAGGGDGFLAAVDDLLFDDRSWSITRIVVRFGRWPNRRRVLVLPQDVAAVDRPAGRLRLNLSADDLSRAPSLESNPPVAMQKRMEIERYVAWEAYWTGLFDRIPRDGDPHLRNTRAVTGHHVFGLDTEAGCVDNFVVDDEGWQIRYLIVRIGSRRDARKVMVEPRWVDSISWEDRGVRIHLPKVEIEHCREFSANDLALSPPPGP